MSEEEKKSSGMLVGAFDMFGGGSQQQADALKYTLDPEDAMKQLEHYLRAEVFDHDSGSWRPNEFNAKPLMTKEGINNYIGHLRGYINKDNVLSNVTLDQIKLIMRDVCKTMRMFLVLNQKRYEIDKKHFTTIYHTTENHIYMFLCRAKDNGERLRLMSQMHIMEQNSRVEEVGRKKRLGGLL